MSDTARDRLTNRMDRIVSIEGEARLIVTALLDNLPLVMEAAVEAGKIQREEGAAEYDVVAAHPRETDVTRWGVTMIVTFTVMAVLSDSYAVLVGYLFFLQPWIVWAWVAGEWEGGSG